MKGQRITGARPVDAALCSRPFRILGVGDGADMIRLADRWAAGAGIECDWVRMPAEIGGRVVACDLLMVVLGDDPDAQLRIVEQMLASAQHRPRIALVARRASMAAALRAARLGVFEVLVSPVGPDQLDALLERVRAVESESVLALPDTGTAMTPAGEIVSTSPAMVNVFRTIARVAPSTATVLVRGESGTGKELVARAIHRHSPRAGFPFVAVNCAAIPEDLLESDLFGHEKGAFTGASARKPGRFERACGGTLLLDEIGDMSLTLQAKILRAVQEREIERVGGSEPIPIDVRLIAATHRDLDRLIEQGRFRQDLYYRLAVVTIELPRLADRGDDLLNLALLFLREFAVEHGRNFTGITDHAVTALRAHEWTGNVRELRNVIERAVLVADGDVLRVDHLPPAIRGSDRPPVATDTDTCESLAQVEARHIRRVLAVTGGHIGEAAAILDLHRNTLARKIRKLGL